MHVAGLIVTTLVAFLHIYLLALEMFLWTKPAGRKAFGLSAEQAESTKVMAANQGLYNGFLAAGLLWGVVLGDTGLHIRIFFLVCVLVAGIFGAATASRKILFVQGLPATLGLVLTTLG